VLWGALDFVMWEGILKKRKKRRKRKEGFHRQQRELATGIAQTTTSHNE